MTKAFTKKNTISQNLGPDLPRAQRCEKSMSIVRTHTPVCDALSEWRAETSALVYLLACLPLPATYTTGYRKCYCVSRGGRVLDRGQVPKTRLQTCSHGTATDLAAHAHEHRMSHSLHPNESRRVSAHPGSKQLQNLNVGEGATVSLKKCFLLRVRRFHLWDDLSVCLPSAMKPSQSFPGCTGQNILSTDAPSK